MLSSAASLRREMTWPSANLAAQNPLADDAVGFGGQARLFGVLPHRPPIVY